MIQKSTPEAGYGPTSAGVGFLKLSKMAKKKPSIFVLQFMEHRMYMTGAIGIEIQILWGIGWMLVDPTSSINDPVGGGGGGGKKRPNTTLQVSYDG